VNSLRTLLVDDDADAARALARQLEAELGPTMIVPDAYQALAHHAERPFDLVVSEVALPGASGIDLLERMAPAVPAVVVTWLVSPAITARAMQAGAHTVLTKPYRIADLLSAARAAARTRTGLEVAAV
jgi:DNA-binding response OmpR family regulator